MHPTNQDKYRPPVICHGSGTPPGEYQPTTIPRTTHVHIITFTTEWIRDNFWDLEIIGLCNSKQVYIEPALLLSHTHGEFTLQLSLQLSMKHWNRCGDRPQRQPHRIFNKNISAPSSDMTWGRTSSVSPSVERVCSLLLATRSRHWLLWRFLTSGDLDPWPFQLKSENWHSTYSYPAQRLYYM